MKDFPRLLFITNEPPHTAAAGSILFHRLFKHYPQERLLVVTNNRLPAPEQRLDCVYATHRLWADRLQRTRFWKWRTAIRVLGGARFLPLHPVDRLVGHFKPEAVVTLMQDSWYYDLAARYARARRLPFILFIHDLAHGFEPVVSWLVKQQLQRDRSIYAQGAARFCVSPGMENWFRREFGLPGEVLLPPRSQNPPTQDTELCRTLKTSGRLTLGYAGGLHYGYGEQIERMIPALRATKARLEMFSPVPTGSLASLKAASDVITFNGYISPPEAAWSKLIRRCDVVLLPYLNPPGPFQLQYQTHFPSKLGDMLCLGLPSLAIGPADASGVKWLNGNSGSAIVMGDPSSEALIRMFQTIALDSNLRVSVAKKARQAGVGDFSPEALGNQMLESIRRAVCR